MADTPITVPYPRGSVAGIIAAAGVEPGSVCPGRVDPGCLVPLNIDANLAASAVVRVRIDPKQACLPLNLQMDVNANLTFTMESGQTSKTINAEGTGIIPTYTPGDFSAARLFAQMNVLPFTGPVTQERPLTLPATNADAMNAQRMRGTMLSMATNNRGRVPEAALRYWLSRLTKIRPDVIQLCAHGYRSIGGGWAEQPKDWCDGQFPPGSIVPLKLARTTVGVPGVVTAQVGPLQPMVPLYADFTGSTATLLVQIRDPQTGKDARVQGGDLLGSPAATGTAGSALGPDYLVTRFTPANFQASINAFPWTSVGMMSRERPLEMILTGAMGDFLEGFLWAIVLDEDNNVPEAAWWYAQMLTQGLPGAA